MAPCSCFSAYTHYTDPRAWNRGWPIDAIDRYPDVVTSAKPSEMIGLTRHCQASWITGFLGDKPRMRSALAGWNP